MNNERRSELANAYVAISAVCAPYRAMEAQVGVVAFMKSPEYLISSELEKAARAIWKLYKQALKEASNEEMEQNKDIRPESPRWYQEAS